MSMVDSKMEESRMVGLEPNIETAIILVVYDIVKSHEFWKMTDAPPPMEEEMKKCPFSSEVCMGDQCMLWDGDVGQVGEDYFATSPGCSLVPRERRQRYCP